MNCKFCGKKVDEVTTTCPFCGMEIEKKEKNISILSGNPNTPPEDNGIKTGVGGVKRDESGSRGGFKLWMIVSVLGLLTSLVLSVLTFLKIGTAFKTMGLAALIISAIAVFFALVASYHGHSIDNGKVKKNCTAALVVTAISVVVLVFSIVGFVTA